MIPIGMRVLIAARLAATAVLRLVYFALPHLQCFDDVGLAAGRAFGL